MSDALNLMLDIRTTPLVERYARTFGIAAQDVLEAEWLRHWVNRHHNQLRYSYVDCKWHWIPDPPAEKEQEG